MDTATALPEIWMRLKDPQSLKFLMEKQHVSARHLAGVAGWKSHTYIQRLLRGEVRTLRTDPALRIAHHLSVPVDLLFLTEADEPKDAA